MLLNSIKTAKVCINKSDSTCIDFDRTTHIVTWS